jgi:hypothetical protein
MCGFALIVLVTVVTVVCGLMDVCVFLCVPHVVGTV